MRTYTGWGGEPAGEIIPELGVPQPGRDRLVCRNKRCGREFVVTSAKLVVACLDALDQPERRERVITVPDDVSGELDTTSSVVAEWRFKR